MKEKKHINRMYENAVCNPDVDAMNYDELEADVRRQAEMLCLDADVCVKLMKKRFPEVTTTDFKKASNLTQIDSPI